MYHKIQYKTSSTKQPIDVYNKYQPSAISVEEVPLDKVERYGIINGEKTEDNLYKINKLVEKLSMDKVLSNPVIMDMYDPTPSIFDKIDETEAGVGGEIMIIDVDEIKNILKS